MKPQNKFAPIIERIEYLRTQLGLNKSRFSAEISMKPQTYNNFIGSQGSKPNVELVVGIVNTFGVNPMWLLNGTGPIFLEEGQTPEQMRYAQGFRGELPVGAAVRESGLDRAQLPKPVDMAGLRKELRAIEPLMEKFESQIKRVEATQFTVVDRLFALLKRYYELDPISAVDEVKQMLTRLDQRISNKHTE